MRRPVTSIVVALAVLFAALPAFAISESGHKTCSSNAHVYTKVRWQSQFETWLDIQADGVRERHTTGGNDGSWATYYLNAPQDPFGEVDSINNAFYYIWGLTLSTVNSWPGCIAD